MTWTKGESIKGKNYQITELDKQEIAKSITVPIVEKVIERTEVIKEIPIVTENVVETIKEDISGEAIVERINNLPNENEYKIDFIHIKNAPKPQTGTNYFGGATVQKVMDLIAENDLTHDTLQGVTDRGATTTKDIEAKSFITTGGTSGDFVKGDGSLDSTDYLPTSEAVSDYVPYTGATQDVDLGVNNLLVQDVKMRGFMSMGDTVDYDTVRINREGPNLYRLDGYNGGILSAGALLDSYNLTTDKTFTFPDESGTFALAENVVTYEPSAYSRDVDLGANSLSVGTIKTVDTPTSGTATQTASGNFYDYGYTYSFSVYAYDSIKGVYSQALVIPFSDTGTFIVNYNIQLGWGAVTGATSYRVVIIDGYSSYSNDAYFDTTLTSFTYDGYTDVNYVGSDATPSPLSPSISLTSGIKSVKYTGLGTSPLNAPQGIYTTAVESEGFLLEPWYADSGTLPYWQPSTFYPAGTALNDGANFYVVADYTSGTIGGFDDMTNQPSKVVLYFGEPAFKTTGGWIGVGIAQPQAPFHLVRGTFGGFNIVTDELAIFQRNGTGSDNASIAITADEYCQIRFGDKYRSWGGMLSYQNSVDRLSFRMNNINVLTTTLDGRTLIGLDTDNMYDDGVSVLQVGGNSTFTGNISGANTRFTGQDIYIGTTLGTEKLTNGTFTGNANGWTADAGWTAGAYMFTTTAPATLPAVGNTYTNNGQTFTYITANTAKTRLVFSGTGAPSASGTLVRTSGSGTTPITFAVFVVGAVHGADGTGTLTNTMLTPPVVGEVFTVSVNMTLLTTDGCDVSAGGVSLGIISTTSTETYSNKIATDTTTFTLTPTVTGARFFIDTTSYKRVADGNLFVGGQVNGGTARFGNSGYSQFEADGTYKQYGIQASANILNTGLVVKTNTVTNTYTVLVTDYTVVGNKATAFTMTLPTAVVGQTFIIKNIGAGVITVDGAGSDIIDGDLTQAVYQWESIQIQCYVANRWIII